MMPAGILALILAHPVPRLEIAIPPKATLVSLNGIQLGRKATFVILNLPAGRESIRFGLPGGGVLDSVVEIGWHRSGEVSRGDSLPEAGYGNSSPGNPRVCFEAKPSDSRLWVDGVEAANMDAEGRRCVRCDTGDHVFSLRHESNWYAPYDGRFTLGQSDTAIHAVLARVVSLVWIHVGMAGNAVEWWQTGGKKLRASTNLPALLVLPPRPCSLTISRRPFYRDSSFLVAANSSEVLEVRESLRPVPFLADGFIRVPSGPFRMGNDHGSLDERPEHTVTLDEFWIGKTEITVAEFRRFTERSGYPFPAKELVPEENNWLLRGRDGYPMNYVSKQDAQAYATWLSKQSGMRCDLPTEAQWEKAARGIDAAIYPWGDAWDASMANFCDKRCPIQWRKNQDDGFATSSPVDAKPGDRSPWGVLGMGGNVSEWCRDAFGFRYPSSPVKNPLSESKGGGNSIVRGGSWRDFPERLQASYRFHYPEDNRYSHIGFRLVVTE